LTTQDISTGAVTVT